MRKIGLILLAVLLLITSFNFSPSVSADSEDGTQDVFDISLPEYSHKPTSYTFTKINTEGRMNYSVHLEGIKARTEITSHGTQVYFLREGEGGLLDSQPLNLNENLNNNVNPIPNVRQATEFILDMFEKWRSYAGTVRTKSGYFSYNDLSKLLGKVKTPIPLYFQGVTWDGIDAKRGAMQVQEATVRLDSYSVRTSDDVGTEFEVNLKFTVSIQFDEIAVADESYGFFYNYHSNIVLERFAVTADKTNLDGSARVNADVSGALSIIEDDDNLTFHLSGGMNRAIPNTNYNDPTWTVERRNPGGMPNVPIPTYLFYIYIKYDDETGELSLSGLNSTNQLLNLRQNFNDAETISLHVEYEKGEYVVVVPILNALQFYEDAANPLNQTRVGNLDWREVSETLTKEFETMIGRAIERILRDIDQTYETSFAQEITGIPAMNFFGNSTDIQMVKDMGVGGNFYYTDRASFEENLQNLLKGGIVLGGSAAAGGVSEELWNEAIRQGADLIRIGGANRNETKSLLEYYLYDPDANSASNRLAKEAREKIFEELDKDYSDKEKMESWHVYTYSHNRIRHLMGDRLLPKSFEARKEILDIAREGWNERDPSKQRYYDERLKRAYEKHLTLDDVVDAYFSFGEGALFRNMFALPYKVKQPENLDIEIIDTGINPKVDGLEEADHTMDEYENLKNREPGQSSYAIPGKTYRATLKVTNNGDFPITNNVVRYYVVSSQPGSGKRPVIYSTEALGMFFGKEYVFDDGVKQTPVKVENATKDTSAIGSDPPDIEGTEQPGFLGPGESVEIEFDWTMPSDNENPDRDPVYLYVTIGEKINENKSMVNQGTAVAPDWAPFFERELLKYAPEFEPATLITFTPKQIISRDEDNTKDKDRHVVAIRFDTVADPDEDPYETPPEELMSEQPFLRFETITTVTESEVPKWIEDGYWADLERAVLKYRRTQWLVE